MAILTICGCVLLGLNFAFCAGMCQYRLYGKSLPDWIKDFFRDNKDTNVELKALEPF